MKLMRLFSLFYCFAFLKKSWRLFLQVSSLLLSSTAVSLSAPMPLIHASHGVLPPHTDASRCAAGAALLRHKDKKPRLRAAPHLAGASAPAVDAHQNKTKKYKKTNPRP